MGAEMGSEARVSSGPVPVRLHIYDVSGNPAVMRINKFFRAVGTGAFHAGVEVYGKEFSFGFTEDGGSGIFAYEPQHCEPHAYRESLHMGHTDLSVDEVSKIIEDMKKEWLGTDYDLLRFNCCHFSSALCKRLGADPVPSWVTNLAGAGATVDNGFQAAVAHAQQAASTAHQTAIIAKAKAGEIDEKYQIRSNAEANAKVLLSRVSELDANFKRDAPKIAATVQRSASGIAQGVSSQASGVLSAGKEARGANSDAGYQFGDFTRGLVRKASVRLG